MPLLGSPLWPLVASGVAFAAFGLAPFDQFRVSALYYQLWLVTVTVLIATGLIALRANNPDARQRAAELGQGLLIGGFFALALGLVTQQLLLTRWVAWGLFQIHDANDFFTSAAVYLLEGSFSTPRGRVISNLLYAGLLDATMFHLRASLWTVAAIAVGPPHGRRRCARRLPGCRRHGFCPQRLPPGCDAYGTGGAPATPGANGGDLG